MLLDEWVEMGAVATDNIGRQAFQFPLRTSPADRCDTRIDDFPVKVPGSEQVARFKLPPFLLCQPCKGLTIGLQSVICKTSLHNSGFRFLFFF